MVAADGPGSVRERVGRPLAERVPSAELLRERAESRKQRSQRIDHKRSGWDKIHVGLLVLVESSGRRVVECKVSQGRGSERRGDECGGESEHLREKKEVVRKRFQCARSACSF